MNSTHFSYFDDDTTPTVDCPYCTSEEPLLSTHQRYAVVGSCSQGEYYTLLHAKLWATYWFDDIEVQAGVAKRLRMHDPKAHMSKLLIVSWHLKTSSDTAALDHKQDPIRTHPILTDYAISVEPLFDDVVLEV